MECTSVEIHRTILQLKDLFLIAMGHSRLQKMTESSLEMAHFPCEAVTVKIVSQDLMCQVHSLLAAVRYDSFHQVSRNLDVSNVVIAPHSLLNNWKKWNLSLLKHSIQTWSPGNTIASGFETDSNFKIKRFFFTEMS